MQSKTVTLVLLLLLATASAVPIQGQQQQRESQCLRTCSRSALDKYQFAAGHTYTYDLKVQSSMSMNTVHNQQAHMEWTATVDLHFETPCQVSLVVKQPRIHGKDNRQFEEQLTKFPLRAIISDGTIEEVCASTDDYTSAVNIKKGILSTIQNTLPSNSTVYSGIQIKETDVVGECSTTYTMKKESSDKLIVQKIKNLHTCDKRFGHPSESVLSTIPLKSTVPMKESKSYCRQTLERGIVKEVLCSDHSEITPLAGTYKFLVAIQQSVLKLKSVRHGSSPSHISSLRKTSLLFDFKNAVKNESKVPELFDQIAKICRVTGSDRRERMPNTTAEEFSKLVKLMNYVPEEAIEIGLQKAISCSGSNDHGLSLYLDALAITKNTGAIKVMVDQMLIGKRMFTFTMRMFTVPRVCSHGVEAVKRIFTNDTIASPVVLAASAVVGRFCTTEGKYYPGGCQEHPTVSDVMNTLAERISHKCSNSRSNFDVKSRVRLLLRSVANIGVMNEQLRQAALNCMKSHSTGLSARIAATETLRSCNCSKQTTEQVMRMAMDQSVESELRICAYRAGIKCANYTQVAALYNITRMEQPSEARSFIQSDLFNLLQSKAPYKAAVSRILAPLNITRTLSDVAYNRSKSVEWSAFTESGTFGTEIIYDYIVGQDKWPRQLRTNMTLGVFKEFINLFDVGLRFENLPTLIKSVLDPNSMIGRTTIGKILRQYISYENMPPSTSGNAELEYFMKLFGIEFFSQSFAPNESTEMRTMAELMQDALYVLKQLTAGEELSMFRGGHVGIDLQIPTIQGIPVFIKQDFIAVLSLSTTPRLRRVDSYVNVAPVFSAISDLFVGYNFGPVIGFNYNSTAYSCSDVEVKIHNQFPTAFNVYVEFPKHQEELISINSSASLLTKLPGEKVRFVPKSGAHDPRTADKKCTQSQGSLKLCFEYDIPSPFQTSDFPLVKASYAKYQLIKEDPTMKGYEFKMAKNQREFGYNVAFDVVGARLQKKLDIVLYYMRHATNTTLLAQGFINENRRGIKIELQNSTTPNKELSVNVVVGTEVQNHSGETVFNGKIEKKTDRRTEIIAKTSGSIEHYFRANVEVDVEVKQLPRSATIVDKLTAIKPRKFEVNLSASHWKLESFVRNQGSSAESSKYKSQLSLEKSSRKVVDLRCVSKIKEDPQSIDAEHQLRAEIAESYSYSVQTKLVASQEKKLINMEVDRADSDKIFKVEMSDEKERSSPNVQKSIVIVKVPNQDVDLKLISLVRKMANTRVIDAEIKSRDEQVLSLRGPITLEWTREAFNERSDLGLRITGTQDTFYLGTEFNFTSQMNNALIDIKNQQRQMIRYHHKLETNYPDVKGMLRVNVPEVLTTGVDLTKTDRHVDVTADVQLQKFSPRHLQGQMKVDTREKQGDYSLLLFWDKSRDQNKKMTLHGAYSVGHSNHVQAHGQVEVEQQKYNYGASGMIARSDSWDHVTKELKIDVTNSTGEVLSLHCANQWTFRFDDANKNARINTEFTLITPSQSELIFRKNFELESSPSDSRMHSRIDLKSSTLGEVMLQLTGNQQYQSQELETQFQGDLITSMPNEHAPTVEIKVKSKLQQYVSKWLKSAEISLEAKTPSGQVMVQASENSESKEASFAVKKDRSQILEIKGKKEGQGSMKVQIDTPAQASELYGKYEESEKSLTFYPERQQKQRKYDARIVNEISSESKKWQASAEFPHKGRQKKVSSSLEVEDQQTTTEMNLDVFSNSNKILKIKIDSRKRDEGIYQLTSSFDTQRHEAGPIVIADVEMTSRNKYLSLSYKKKPQEVPSMLFSSKYSHLAENHGVVSALLKTPRKKIELGGVLSKQNDIKCFGYKLNTTVSASSSQGYGFEVSACSPAFVKVITTNKQTSDRYVAKFGLKEHRHAEISFMMDVLENASSLWRRISGSTKQQKEIPIAALSAKLPTPEILSLRGQYNEQSIEPSMSLIKREWEQLKDLVKSVAREVQQRFSQDLDETCPELKEAIEELSHALSTVFEHELLQKLKQITESLSESIFDLFKKILRIISDTIKETGQLWKEAIEEIKELINDGVAAFKRLAQAILAQIKEWFGYEGGSQLVLSAKAEELLTSVEVSAKDMIDDLIEQLCSPSIKCDYVKKVLHSYVTQLRNDTSTFGNLLLKDESVQYARSVLKRTVDMLEKQEYVELLQRAIVAVTKQNAGLVIERTGIEINIPLKRPTTCLMLAPYNLGFDQRNQSRLFRQQRLSSLDDEYKFYRVTGRTLITHTHSNMTLPSTHCPYYLSKHFDDSIIYFEKVGTPDYSLVFRKENVEFRVAVNQKLMKLNGRQFRVGDQLPTSVSRVISVKQVKDPFIAIISEACVWVFDPTNGTPVNHFKVVRNSTGLGLINIDPNKPAMDQVRPFSVESGCHE